MIKLEPLQRDYADVLDLCCKGMNHNKTKSCYFSERDNFLARADEYGKLALTSNLHQLPDENSLGKLNDTQLNRLYEYYFRDSSKPARVIYDEIKLLGRRKCPYCGLANNIVELDHYLPISTHSAYSVLPINLIPSCKNCNQGLRATKPTTADSEYFHPYFLQAEFVTEKWIGAAISWDNSKNPDDAYTIEYEAQRVAGWTETQNNRAQTHFKVFNLATAYEAESNIYMRELIYIVSRAQDANEVTTILGDELERAKSVYWINHWKPVLIAAVLASDEFCSANFG